MSSKSNEILEYLGCADQALQYSKQLSGLTLSEVCNEFDRNINEWLTIKIQADLVIGLGTLHRICKLLNDEGLLEEPHRYQLAAAAAMFNENIIHMENGQGKTLAAAITATLLAKMKRRVHVTTDNNYLIQRDATWMYPLFSTCGLSVSIRGSWKYLTGYQAIGNDFEDVRKINLLEIYQSNIVYANRRTLIVDFLNDNLVIEEDDIIQGELDFVLIDEADSTLIDNARQAISVTHPYLSANETTDERSDFEKAWNISSDLLKEIHFEIEKSWIYLNDEGQNYIEKTHQLSLYDDPDVLWIRLITQCLRAKYTMIAGTNYAVEDRVVRPIDENGRTLENSVFSDGLQQALHLKERLEFVDDSETAAKISIQNFFQRYNSIGGMSGSVWPVREEIENVYDTRVISIPNQFDNNRIDEAPAILHSYEGRNNKVVNEAIEKYAKGQPVLIGVENEEVAEDLITIFNKHQLSPTLLTATQHEQEAGKILNLGMYGGIIISAKLAGRGTDIKLSDSTIEAGGLHVIVVGLMEERIENQLRGRAGRQGLPGSTICYISLDDPLIKAFAGNRAGRMMKRMGLNDDEIVSHSLITGSINRVRKKIIENNYLDRNGLYKADSIVDGYRQYFYELRRSIFSSNPLEIDKLISAFVKNQIDRKFDLRKQSNSRGVDAVTQEVIKEIRTDLKLPLDLFADIGELKLLEDRKSEITDRFVQYVRNNKTDLINRYKDFSNKEELINRLLQLSIFIGLDKAWSQFIQDCNQMYARANRGNIARTWLSNWIQDRVKKHFLRFIGTAEQLVLYQWLKLMEKDPSYACSSIFIHDLKKGNWNNWNETISGLFRYYMSEEKDLSKTGIASLINYTQRVVSEHKISESIAMLQEEFTQMVESLDESNVRFVAGYFDISMLNDLGLVEDIIEKIKSRDESLHSLIQFIYDFFLSGDQSNMSEKEMSAESIHILSSWKESGIWNTISSSLIVSLLETCKPLIIGRFEQSLVEYVTTGFKTLKQLEDIEQVKNSFEEMFGLQCEVDDENTVSLDKKYLNQTMDKMNSNIVKLVQELKSLINENHGQSSLELVLQGGGYHVRMKLYKEDQANGIIGQIINAWYKPVLYQQYVKQLDELDESNHIKPVLDLVSEIDAFVIPKIVTCKATLITD